MKAAEDYGVRLSPKVRRMEKQRTEGGVDGWVGGARIACSVLKFK